MKCSLFVMCNLGDPGKSHLPARFFLLQSCQMFHTFWERNIILLPISLEEVRCIHENFFCELYVVKFWERMVQNSFSHHTIPKAWYAAWFSCSRNPSLGNLLGLH